MSSWESLVSMYEVASHIIMSSVEAFPLKESFVHMYEMKNGPETAGLKFSFQQNHLQVWYNNIPLTGVT